jgi:hypothetical protein
LIKIKAAFPEKALTRNALEGGLSMDRKQILQKSLEPFDNVAVVKRYFSAVKAMDRSALAKRNFNTDRIMALWHDEGRLTISGKPMGEHSFSGAGEISTFYERRAKGIGGEISVNISSIQVANAKNSEHVVASGQRYVVTASQPTVRPPIGCITLTVAPCHQASAIDSLSPFAILFKAE